VWAFISSFFFISLISSFISFFSHISSFPPFLFTYRFRLSSSHIFFLHMPFVACPFYSPFYMPPSCSPPVMFLYHIHITYFTIFSSHYIAFHILNEGSLFKLLLLLSLIFAFYIHILLRRVYVIYSIISFIRSKILLIFVYIYLFYMIYIFGNAATPRLLI